MTYATIADLSPREPVGAVLRIGKKGPKGNPVDRDQFYIASRYENKDGIRPLLPDFAPFNDLKPENRRSFRGNLVHATEAEAFNYHLSARVLGSTWRQWPKAHPNMRPVCAGDGTKATRLYGIAENGDEDWREIDCPNQLCEFRQSNACKPWARLYFMPRWKEGSRLPAPMMVFSTMSWHTIANIKGFFDHVANFAAEARMDRWSFFGLPFVLELGEKKDKKKGHVFPVVSMAVDGNLAYLFGEQRMALESAGGKVPQLVGAVSEAEQAPEVEAADYRDITPGIPGQAGLPLE